MSQNHLDLLIKNASVLIFDETKPFEFRECGYRRETLNIGISSGKISYLGTDSPSAKDTLDANGLHVLPGLIDSQVHFREPGLTHKEDLESGMQGAALGGITSVFEMPNTVPATTTAELFADKLHRAQGRAATNYAFYIGGSPDNVNELAKLESHAHCPGIKIFMGSSTGSLLVEDDPTLEEIFRKGKYRVILHSEDEYRLRERKKIALDSKDVRLHPVWRDEESAFSSTTRLLGLARNTGRKVHVLHVTTQQEMELLAKNKDIASVEVLPQHLTLSAPECYERLGTKAQQNPPIREKHHQEALWKAVLTGVVDVMGSDHAPHTAEEKSKEYPNTPSGMPMVQTLVPIMLNHVHHGKLTLERFVYLMSESQRKLFGIKGKGRIALGYDADLTVVDLKKQMTIENSWIVSKSKWSPFDGYPVTGWPIHTLVAGQFAVRDEKLTQIKPGKAIEFEK